MKANSTQQEILLVTGTSFLTREFCETPDELTYNHLTEKEKLKVACRKGLLPHILPEIFELHPINKKLSLWEMGESLLFIEFKPGEMYVEVELQFSIDPYSFMPFQILS
jgi:hypothetical protein